MKRSRGQVIHIGLEEMKLIDGGHAFYCGIPSQWWCDYDENWWLLVCRWHIQLLKQRLRGKWHNEVLIPRQGQVLHYATSEGCLFCWWCKNRRKPLRSCCQDLLYWWNEQCMDRDGSRHQKWKENGWLEYPSLLRDEYSILPLLRGFCSADAARTVEIPSEVVVECTRTIFDGQGIFLLLWRRRTTEAGNDHFCVWLWF